LGIDIRSGCREDTEQIAEFQIRMALETEGMHLDRETVNCGVSAVFDDPSRGEYWVAESESGAVGVLLTVPEWSDWRNGTVLWIHSLYVLPEWRGKGVFRALYDQLRNQVVASGNVKGLRLYVDRRNSHAQAVYNRLGMTAEHYQLFEWMKDA
jgi:GNAT superfamily N-acetyltransferase